MAEAARLPTRVGHANTHPWKHVPLDFEDKEIMRTLLGNY